MVTTVTTTTVMGNALSTGTLTLIVILTLLSLLIQKEIIGGLTSAAAQRLSNALNIAIVPIGVAFCASLFLQLLDMLR